jgi:hypothetical protein
MKPETDAAKTMRTKSEQRSGTRVSARLPVNVRTSSGSTVIDAHTRDVSTSGVFFYTNSPLIEGSEIELVLILPPELTSGLKGWVCCQAHVLRVETGLGSEFGIAARIDRMDLLPEIPN